MLLSQVKNFRNLQHRFIALRKGSKLLVALSIFIISLNASYASTQSEIQSLVKKYNLTDAKIAIATQRTMTGNDLYSYSQNRSMKPASNNKVFTIVSGLLSIPDDFRFTTTILYPSNRVNNHVLHGDMYIKFTGNPALMGGQLSSLIKKLKQKREYPK